MEIALKQAIILLMVVLKFYQKKMLDKKLKLFLVMYYIHQQKK